MSIQPGQRAQLRDFLTDRFSISELKNIAFDIGVDYETFQHNEKSDFARELILFCERRDRIGCLLERINLLIRNEFITTLIATNPPCIPSRKVQVFVDQETIKQADISHVIANLSEVLKVSSDQISVVGAAWGSIRLLVSLPDLFPVLIPAFPINTLLGNIRIKTFSTEDYNTWRTVSTKYPPIVRDDIFIPTAIWKRITSTSSNSLPDNAAISSIVNGYMGGSLPNSLLGAFIGSTLLPGIGAIAGALIGDSISNIAKRKYLYNLINAIYEYHERKTGF